MKGYITRDKNGQLALFTGKPFKRGYEWVASVLDIMGVIDDCDLPEGANPQWEDEEPIAVEVVIKKI